jgi:hypothetical protein
MGETVSVLRTRRNDAWADTFALRDYAWDFHVQIGKSGIEIPSRRHAEEKHGQQKQPGKQGLQARQTGAMGRRIPEGGEPR